MPSAKILAQKQADLGALVEKIKGAQSGVLVDYTGITVEQDTKLRASFRTSGVDYKVYKNTMTSRACDEVGYAEMKELLKGMTAFALSTEDPIAPARIAKKFADDIETFDIKGGFLDGRVLSRDEVLELADIPSKETPYRKSFSEASARPFTTLHTHCRLLSTRTARQLPQRKQPLQRRQLPQRKQLLPRRQRHPQPSNFRNAVECYRSAQI